MVFKNSFLATHITFKHILYFTNLIIILFPINCNFIDIIIIKPIHHYH